MEIDTIYSFLKTIRKMMKTITTTMMIMRRKTMTTTMKTTMKTKWNIENDTIYASLRTMTIIGDHYVIC